MLRRIGFACALGWGCACGGGSDGAADAAAADAAADAAAPDALDLPPPTTLFEGPAGAWAIDVDDTHVYWTNGYEGTLQRVPKGGGAPPEPLASGMIGAEDVHVLDAYAYVGATGNGTTSQNGGIVQVPAQGGASVTLAASQYPTRIAVDATHVYWVNGNVTDAEVRRVPVIGGPVEPLASGPWYAFGIAVDATHVYWASEIMPNGLHRMPLAGGAAEQLVAGNHFRDATIDGGYVYYADWSGGGIKRIPVAGGTPEDVAGAGFSWGLVVDGQDVFYGDGRYLRRGSSTGGDPTIIAVDKGNVMDVAVDATHVYWVSHTSDYGAVRMLARP